MTSRFNRRIEKPTRRDFIKNASGLAAFATGVGVLGYARYGTDPVYHEPEKVFQFPDFASGSSSVYPALSIARGTTAQPLVRSAVGQLGGMQRFVKKGEKVLIKPNVGWDRQPEQAANTSPEVISEVIKLVREAGAGEILVTDVSINNSVRSFQRSGIAQAAEEAGATVLYPNSSDFLQTDFKGEILKVWPVYRHFLEADRLINVPIVKHHTLSSCTLGMKNLYGVLGGRRNQLHQKIHVSIADLAVAIKPTLTIMDAVRVLRSNGPTGGSLDDVSAGQTVAASADQVALDSFSLSFLGLKADDVPYLQMGEARGLGVANWRSLNFKEELIG